jgi:hypothetical protein
MVFKFRWSFFVRHSEGAASSEAGIEWQIFSEMLKHGDRRISGPRSSLIAGFAMERKKLN